MRQGGAGRDFKTVGRRRGGIEGDWWKGEQFEYMFGWSRGYFLEENLFMPGFKGKHPPTDLLSAGFYPCLIIGASRKGSVLSPTTGMRSSRPGSRWGRCGLASCLTMWAKCEHFETVHCVLLGCRKLQKRKATVVIWPGVTPSVSSPGYAPLILQLDAQ